MMRHPLSLGAAAIIYTLPSVAHGHGGLTLNDDHGGGLFWIYAIVLGGILGVIVFRIYLRSTRPPVDRRLIRRLAELESALTSNLAKLRNAEKYPAECGLSTKERQSLLDTMATIRRLIEEEKLKSASAQDDARSAAT